jgi:hypothetical protein
MTTVKTAEIKFLTDGGKQYVLRVRDCVDDIADRVEAAATAIIASGAVDADGEDLVSSSGATITEVTKIDVDLSE